MSCGKNVYINKNCHISGNINLEIGDHVWIGHNFFSSAEGGVKIKSGVIISHNVEIWSQNHYFKGEDLKFIPYDKRFIKKNVVIEENVWIGSRVIILPGVTIGEGAIIGAGSVVSKNVPACAIVGGNPINIISHRDTEQYYKLKAEGKIYLKHNYNYDVSSDRLI